MSPVGATFVPFPPKTGTKLLHPRPPQSLNGFVQFNGLLSVLGVISNPTDVPHRVLGRIRNNFTDLQLQI